MNTLYLLLKNLWAKIRYSFNYSVLSASAGSATFALIGNVSGRKPYCRTYLNQRDFIKVHAVWYKGGTNIARKLVQTLGLVVIAEKRVSATLFYQVLRVPNFISTVIELPDDLLAYMASITMNKRSNIRRLKNKGFTSRVVTESAWGANFYHDYHKPTMARSHGDEAYTHVESSIYERFREPGMEFVQVYLNGTCVGAVMGRHDGSDYHLIALGWQGGDDELRKKDVPSALYWYCICRAMELGCNRLNLGGTPPYFESGVTQFKLHWGATICKELSTYGYRDLLLNPANPHCYNFLEKNSIVAYGKDNCLIVLSSKLPGTFHLRDQFMRNIESWYLLRSEENDEWHERTHSNLPPSLRNWYQYIELPDKNAVSEEAEVHETESESVANGGLILHT